jgi:hypothetical protein
MGYDLIVLDANQRSRLASGELRPDEWQAVWDASRERSMTMLMTLPDFYGDERLFSSEEIRTLISELDRLDSDPTRSPGLARASRVLRTLAEAALAHAQPLLVLPD